MKNLVLISIVLLVSLNESYAQRNFGKRKFSRNLFSKNIGFNSSKHKQEEGKATHSFKIETRNEIEVAEIDFKPILMDEIVHELNLIEVQETIVKPKRVEIKKVENTPKFAAGISETAAKPNVSTAIQKFEINKQSVSQQQKRNFRTNDFIDFLMDAAGWLLTVAICLGFILLSIHYPLIAGLIAIIVAIAIIWIVFAALGSFFMDFFSFMGH